MDDDDDDDNVAALVAVGRIESVFRYRLGELSSTNDSEARTPCVFDEESSEVALPAGTKKGIRPKSRSSLRAPSLELDAHHD